MLEDLFQLRAVPSGIKCILTVISEIYVTIYLEELCGQ